MSTKENQYQLNASDSRMYKHLYLRGNFQQDMFYDKVDKINVWNRLWLSAAATNTQILSVAILDNHLHITASFDKEKGDSSFMHHFRLSITQYHNRRYKVKGILGTRKFSRAILKDSDDMMDCISYHIRNVLHHHIHTNFMDYQFSTARFVFNLEGPEQTGFYTSQTLPNNLKLAYLPVRVKLPKNWIMTRSGLIIPPLSVFRSDILQSMYQSREKYLEILTHKTRRESDNAEDPQYASDSRSVDELVAEFIQKICQIPIASMTEGQKMEAIYALKDELPKTSLKTLQRLFGIPATTLRYRLNNWHKRE